MIGGGCSPARLGSADPFVSGPRLVVRGRAAYSGPMLSWRTLTILCCLAAAVSSLGGCGDDGPTSTEGTETGTGDGDPGDGDGDPGDGDGDAGVCSAAPDDDACDTCTKANCCDELTACVADADCLCVTECIDMGGDSATCHTDCSLSMPNPTFGVLVTCLSQSCSNECA